MECRNHPGERRKMYENTALCELCAEKEGSRLYDEQKGKCAICGTEFGPRKFNGEVPSSAQLDHNHLTGQVRGVLCLACNLRLGKFDEDPGRLPDAAGYLEKWRQTTGP
jgi:ribosomal protein L37E